MNSIALYVQRDGVIGSRFQENVCTVEITCDANKTLDISHFKISLADNTYIIHFLASICFILISSSNLISQYAVFLDQRERLNKEAKNKNSIIITEIF